jgi:hypothetical protein
MRRFEINSRAPVTVIRELAGVQSQIVHNIGLAGDEDSFDQPFFITPYTIVPEVSEIICYVAQQYQKSRFSPVRLRCKFRALFRATAGWCDEHWPAFFFAGLRVNLSVPVQIDYGGSYSTIVFAYSMRIFHPSASRTNKNMA